MLQQICDASLALICKTCNEEKQKSLLVRAGVLTALTDRLACFIVTEGHVIPSVDSQGLGHPHREAIPQPAPKNAHLTPILETIGLLIDNSKANAMMVLTNPAIATVLPPASDGFSPADLRKNPWGATYFSGAAVPRSRVQTPLDALLPLVPDFDEPGVTSNFPPLSSTTSVPKRRSSSIRPASEAPTFLMADDVVEDQERSLLVPWLLLVVRTYRGRRRLLASLLLVAFFKHNLVTPSRLGTFKAIVTPVLVQLLDQKHHEDEDRILLLTRIPYSMVVPFVLAKLIMDDERLQKVAVDSKAISKLAICLKATFEPPTEKAALWRPTRQAPTAQSETIESSLGPGGPSLEQRHTMFYREGLLQALAAIAPFNDHYRKEICDQGVLAQIMLALEPFHSEASVNEDEDVALATSGNSASTLLAACDAVRALTRSVTALRTKLVDADIGKAIVKLLHSSDPEVAIAATKVIANLAIDFSPMKPSISEPALVKKLCEQAHSANAKLRLESIWALKHLVLRSNNKLKRDVVDELGANWIRHLIATDCYNIPPGEVIGLREKEYPPRSAQYAGTGDVVMSEDSEDDEAVTIDAVGDHTTDYIKHTVEDDLAIQEQLLDLLRNLFCGENSAEIMEYVLGEIGHHEFIQILMERLKSKTTIGATRKSNQVSPAPPGILTSTLYIIVHVAACTPKFRSMLTNNTTLMKQILSFHSHADRRIRAAVCWITINLTYSENVVDKDACRIRAIEMNRVGYLTHMRGLERDPELDVRERAKTAVLLLEKLVP